MMPHHQQLKELVQKEMEYESSSSSSSASFVCLLQPQTSPTTSIHTNNISCFNHNPPYHNLLTHLFGFRARKLNPSSSSSSHAPTRTWERLKALCLAHLPTMDAHAPLEIKKNKYEGLQKREELEREVSVLHKMLAHEQKVHEFLERLHHRQDGSALSIPNFLPPKMKEILAELAMVENEITRLESQIKHLQGEVKLEKENNIDMKYKEWGRGALQNHHHHHHHHHQQPPATLPPHPNTRRPNEKAAFDTKALHFISKAIKGDYHLPNFTNDKSFVSKGPPGHKENAFHEEGGVFREKLSKRSGLIKPPSPLREPRHPTPRRDRSLDVPTDYSSKVLSTPLHTEEESIQRWPPNKLSENIMKCLIFIYVRLLRTSRVMEIEKSGSIARSTNLSMSFRAETSSNSKTSLMLHKDSRQQDPYGIFDSEASIPRDIGPYKNLVRFTSTSMDLKCIQNSSSVPKNLDCHELIFDSWIQGYLVPNKAVIFNQATLNIAGNTINARAIEHFILRNPEDSLLKEILGKEKDCKEMIVGELYGLETPDPNIIFALCCGTRSSPAVSTAEGVTAELERSKLEYLQAAIMVSGAKKIALPQLLLTNMKDFGADKESLMEWVCQQLPTSGSLRKSIVDCFRGSHGGKGGAQFW